MAFISEAGVLISHSCKNLIKELKREIDEFDDFNVYAIIRQKDGATFIFDYIHAEDGDNPEVNADPELGERQEKMSAKKLLRYLREQNEPVKEFPRRF